MSAYDYESLKYHIGHAIVCVGYGDAANPVNVAVECETCNTVLMDYDHPDNEPPIVYARKVIDAQADS
jgi:hypothetical protein